MPRVSRRGINPEDPKAIVEAVEELQLAIEGLEFGDPQNPYDPSSAVLAGGNPATGLSHPGTLVNVKGAWAEADVVAADTAVTFYHNLNLPVPLTGEANVRAILMWVEHSGNTANAASTISWNFETGDTVAANSIQLRFYWDGTRVVGAAPDALKVSFFFIPAVRRP